MTTTELVHDLSLPEIDYHDGRYAAEPAQVLREAREASWLARSIRGYEVLSHPIASQLSVDRNHLDGVGSDYYAEQQASELIIRYASEGMLPLMPWVRHDPIRRVLQRGFNQARIKQLTPLIRLTAERLFEAREPDGGLDLVADFADRYPIEVVCALLGIPVEDVPLFTDWTVSLARLSHNPIGPYQDEIDDALSHLYRYFTDLVAARRRSPGGDDFVSTIIQAGTGTEDGVKEITDGEMFGALVNLLFAGHDTTRLQFGWVVMLLMQNRDQWELLVDNPDLARGAVEESMRLCPSLHTVLRTVTDELVVGDVRFPVGTTLSFNTFAANRDPEVFDDPDRFDIERHNAATHLTFGRGHRLCLGQVLARTEMTQALQVLATRYPDMHLDGVPELSDPSAATVGPERLPLSFRA